jgi:hypothetical protein
MGIRKDWFKDLPFRKIRCFIYRWHMMPFGKGRWLKRGSVHVTFEQTTADGKPCFVKTLLNCEKHLLDIHMLMK